jgi:hypothetical protein
MGNTINVKVDYIANEDCRKELLRLGLNANSQQEIVIQMPIKALTQLPIYVNGNGLAEITVKEHHYEKAWNDTLHSLDGTIGVVCVCCGKRTENTSLSKPLNTYDDILKVMSDNDSRLIIAKSKITEIVNHKAEITKLEKDLTAEITTKLEAIYSQSNQKLNSIKILLKDKTRIRTAQIKSIIDG